MSDIKVLAEMIVKQEDKIEGLGRHLKDRSADVVAQHNLRVEESREYVKEIDDLKEEVKKFIGYGDGLRKYLNDTIEVLQPHGSLMLYCELKVYVAELKEEIEKLKTEKDARYARGNAVTKALFGDGYVYAGMDELLSDIKKKMDRHEKAKEENAALKASNDAMNGTLSIIERHCDLAKVSHKENPADMKVEWLSETYITEQAKASKLNAEKLAYMRIVKDVLTDCTEIVEIEDKYKSYLAGAKK